MAKVERTLRESDCKNTDPDSPVYPVLERYKELIQTVQRNVERAQEKQRHYYDLRRRQALFQVGDLVWVRTHPLSWANEGFMAKLAAKWKGPAKVIKCLGPVNYSVSFVDDPDHVDSYVQNLKPFYGHVETFQLRGGGNM